MIETLTVDILGACNFNCEYCYNPDREGKLGVEEVLGYISQFDPSLVSFGGGEPFLHDGLVKMAQEIAKTREMCISTNGTIMNTGLLSLPEELRKKVLLQISIPSGEKEIYRKITGKDMLEEVVHNLSEFSRRFRTFINCPIYQGNFDSIEFVIEIGRKYKSPVRLSLVIPSGNGKNVGLVNPKQIERIKYLALQGQLEGTAYSPLTNIAPLCPLFNRFYGIEGNQLCLSEKEKKVYINQHGERKECEFMK